MRELSQLDTQKVEIGRLADFLKLKISNLDEMNLQQRETLLKQLVAICQMKLTRLSLRH